MKRPTMLVPVWLIAWAGLLACRGMADTYDWQPPPSKVTLLAFWAHPDDEGICGGGSLPYYSTVLNVPTMLVCMTTAWDPISAARSCCCAAWTYGLRYNRCWAALRISIPAIPRSANQSLHQHHRHDLGLLGRTACFKGTAATWRPAKPGPSTLWRNKSGVTGPT